MNSKDWYKSKTVWVSVLTIAVSTATQFADILPPEYASKLLGVVGAANLVLRFFTTTSIVNKQGTQV